jgi:predicted transposase/invertase (TIGR01784 family)
MQTKRPYDPTKDPLHAVIFAKIFEDERAAVPMLSFINAVLEDSGDPLLTGIEKLHSELVEQNVSSGLKTVRLDVYAKSTSGTSVNVEVQLEDPSTYNFINRSIYYASGLLWSSMKSGKNYDYDQLLPVIAINLLGYTEKKFRDMPYHQPVDITFRGQNGRVASNLISVHNLELPKFQNQVTEYRTNLEKWLYAFTQGVFDQEYMKEVIGMDEGLTQYLERYNIATTDPDTIHRAIAYQVTVNDAVNKLNHAEKKGHEKGLEEGIGIGEKRGIEKGIGIGEKRGFESAIKTLFINGNITVGMELAQSVGYPEERTQELLDQAQIALKEQQNDSESMSGPQMGM